MPSDKHMEAARALVFDGSRYDSLAGDIATALANAEREGMTRAAEMRELVISFVKDEIDVMMRNHLGDPEKQHNVKWARKLGITREETAILSKAGEKA